MGLCVALLASICLGVGPAAASAAEGRPFGIESFTVQSTRTVEVPRGTGTPSYGFVEEPYASTQAAGHPDALTIGVGFDGEEVGEAHRLARNLKNLVIDLPPGLTANPQAVAQCSLKVVLSSTHCPANTQVGVYLVHTASDDKVLLGPIVNVVPETGQPARLALEMTKSILMSGRLVHTAQGYGLAVVADGLPAAGIVSMQATLWGTPALESHNGERGLSCFATVGQEWSCEGGGAHSGESPVPFLTMGSDCAAGPQLASANADSWEEAENWVQAQASLPTSSGPLQGMGGCNLLAFTPSVEVNPETSLADEPLGLGVNVQMPQSEEAQTAGTPPLREALVVLPRGVSISAAVAGGLRACAEHGPEGIDMPTGLNANGAPLLPEEVGEGEQTGPDGLASLAPGHCPVASAIGSVEASTPLLSGPLKGRIYLAQPGCGAARPCGTEDALDGTLYRVYVELGVAGTSTDIKLAGYVSASPASGQLTLSLHDSPQLPLSGLTIRLNGGPGALLDSPPFCGSATTTTDLLPWSAPGTTPAGLVEPGSPDATPSSSYEVLGCTSPAALHPGFLAGTVTARGGAFSPLSFSVTRGDREQYLSQIQLHAPPGLLGMLASVPLCEAALANAGKCPQASRIGATTVSSGAGSSPLEMPGSVYLTGPYGGAPFGLSIVTPAQVGPFNLGLITIRARIEIDPQSGALTITSDRLPQIVLGIPLRLRRITLELDRPGFIFNPTNCESQQITATVTGTLGASAEVSSPFAAGDCKSLAFKPALTASASGRAGASAGASLDVKLAFPASAPGSEANLKRIKLALPKQIASRLTTLQRACEDSVFEANPAACPRASIVGAAKLRTPVLGAPLAGPVYFVSHGGAAFPSLVVVLQGDGIRFDLTGSTEIDAKNITSATFAAVPDVPVSSFELYLPQGAHSALGAGASLCLPARTVTVRHSVTRRVHGRLVQRTVSVRKRVTPSLAMGTELVAQNGAVLHKRTKLDVSGCREHVVKRARQARIPKFKTTTFL